MKRALNFLLFLSVLLPLLGGHANDQLDWSKGDLRIVYQPVTQSYELFEKDKLKKSYPRHLVHRLVADLDFEYGLEAPQLIESLKTHATLEFISGPNSEELLTHAFQMKDAAFDILDQSGGEPCEFRSFSDPSRYTIELAPAHMLQLEQDSLGAHFEQQGFLSLGKLTGMSIELMTNNDNLLHGLSEKTGATEYNRGIEGDDRGRTFGLDGELKIEFESGEINVRSTHQGYSRLAPQPSTYSIGGVEYVTYHRRDADGALYQEFMNIEGLEVEVKKILPGNDIFIKIDGKQEIFDQKGVAQKLQQKWHETHKDSGVVQYHNLDHMDKTKRYEMGASVGKDFVLYQGSRHQVRSEIYTGVGFSSDSDFHNLRVGADLRYQYHRRTEGDERYPIFEAKVFTGAKRYADGETDTQVGLELTRRFQVSKNGFFYIKGGVAQEDERYSRDFGQEEIQRRGRLDLQHRIGAGFELRF